MKTLNPVTSQSVNPLMPQEAQDHFQGILKPGIRIKGWPSKAQRKAIMEALEQIKEFDLTNVELTIIFANDPKLPHAQGAANATPIGNGKVNAQIRINADVSGSRLVHVCEHEVRHMAQFLLGLTWNVNGTWIWLGADIAKNVSWHNDPAEMDAEVVAFANTVKRLDGDVKIAYIKEFKKAIKKLSNNLNKWNKKNKVA